MIDVLLWLAVIAVAYLGVRLWQVSRPKPPEPRPPTQEERDFFVGTPRVFTNSGTGTRRSFDPKTGKMIFTHPHPPPPEKLLP